MTKQGEILSSIVGTVGHLRYLYIEHEDTAKPVLLFVLPSVVMAISAGVVEYAAQVQTIGPVLAGAMAVILVVLAIIAIAKAAPMMPIQVKANKSSYKLAVGWIWAATATTMIYFFYMHLVDVWSKEPAGQVTWMPQVLAAIGVGGLAVAALAYSMHQLPPDAHNAIMDHEKREAFMRDIKIMKHVFRRKLAKLLRNAQVVTALNTEEETEWKKTADQLVQQLHAIEKSIYAELEEAL
jgi:hypothetical protein